MTHSGWDAVVGDGSVRRSQSKLADLEDKSDMSW